MNIRNICFGDFFGSSTSTWDSSKWLVFLLIKIGPIWVHSCPMESNRSLRFSMCLVWLSWCSSYSSKYIHIYIYTHVNNRTNRISQSSTLFRAVSTMQVTFATGNKPLAGIDISDLTFVFLQKQGQSFHTNLWRDMKGYHLECIPSRMWRDDFTTPINLDLFHSYWRAWIKILYIQYTLIPRQHVSLTSPTAVDKHDFHVCINCKPSSFYRVSCCKRIPFISIQHLLDLPTSNTSFPFHWVTLQKTLTSQKHWRSNLQHNASNIHTQLQRCQHSVFTIYCTRETNLQDFYCPWIIICSKLLLMMKSCTSWNEKDSTVVFQQIPAEWCMILSITSVVEVVHGVISKRYLA